MCKNITETVTLAQRPQSLRLFTETVTHPTIGGVDAKTLRTINVRRLVEAAGGPTAFADLSAERWAAGYSKKRWEQGQISQWTSLERPKGIGHALARDIEQVAGKPRGWLDQFHRVSDEDSAPYLASQPTRLDVAMLASVIETVEGAIADARVPLPAKARARVIALLYDEWVGSTPDPARAVAVALSAILNAVQESSNEPAGPRRTR